MVEEERLRVGDGEKKGNTGGSSVGSATASSFDARRRRRFFSFPRETRKTTVAETSSVAFRSRRGKATANRAESRLEIFRGNRSRPRRARRGVRARPSVAGRRRVTARRARRLVSVCQASAVETRAEREAGCGDARGGHRASSGGPVRSPGPTRWEARDARVGFRAGGASRNTRTELGTSPLAAAARLKHSPMTPRASRVTCLPREVVK